MIDISVARSVTETTGLQDRALSANAAAGFIQNGFSEKHPVAVRLYHVFKSGFHIHNYRLSVGGVFLLRSVGLTLCVMSVADTPDLGSELIVLLNLD